MGQDTLLFENFGKDIEPDRVIFSEGDSGDRMFIIQEGKIKITKKIQGKEHLLAILGKGEFFGEMALVNQIKRTASAATMTNVRLLGFDRDEFQKMIEKNPGIALSIIDRLCRRLNSAVEKMKHFMTRGEDGVVALNLYYAFKESTKNRKIEDYEAILDEIGLHLNIPRTRLEAIMESFLKAGILKLKGNELSLVNEEKLYQLVETL
ncbi:MAG: cyclic nucleotide-binding domain-containing protein [Spirochaetales bacterium]|nr:cyclic nucleotide-binding domain-containing protein [Spirochaetales bacterium]